jgi:branched-chain amino acid aminotransferase
LNGTLTPWNEAHVSVLSHAIQRGALVFDVGPLRYVEPRSSSAAASWLLFRPREHVARLLRSAALIGHQIPWSEAQLLDATVTAARAAVAAGTTSALVRWSAYVPTVEPDVVPRSAVQASVAIAVITPEDSALPGTEASAPKAETVRLQVPRDVRKAGPEVFPPQAKVAASYLGPMLAKRAALAAGYDEVVLLDREGHVAEGPTCNVFAVRGGELVTPPLERVLAGITRDAVLAIARAEGIPAREAHLTAEELAGADEAFLTASSLPVQAIASVDGRALVAGAPGPVTRRLRAALMACERGEDPRFASWVVDVRG